MPVTKTAKRALRSSKRKARVNSLMRTRLEIAVRLAKRGKKEKDVLSAISITDKLSKNHVIHKNKAAHLKSTLSKLLPKTLSRVKAVKSPKTSKKQK
jgi:small subunit ribosomal protein S20